MNHLVLIDRDGTINVEKNYLSSPDELELLPGAAHGILRIKRLGLKPVLVTNQSAIARGYFDLQALSIIHHHLQRLLTLQGASLDAIYFCPHHPDEGCNCRKPAPGLAYQAAIELKADLSRSFVIGDNVCDIELGKAIGAKAILVRTGYGERLFRDGTVNPDWVVNDLLEASLLIESLGVR